VRNKQKILDQIQQFDQHYDYDSSYLLELLADADEAFAAFDSGRSMIGYRSKLPADAYYVAAITVMRIEDCGTCLQLNLKMALEAGMESSILRLCVEAPDKLPTHLRDIMLHAQAVSLRESPDPEGAARIKERYGNTAFAELALLIATVRIYPLLKRAMLKATSCSATRFSYQ